MKIVKRLLLCIVMLLVLFESSSADPVDSAKLLFQVEIAVLDSCVAIASIEFDKYSEYTKKKILLNINERMTFIHNLEKSGGQIEGGLDSLYKSFEALPPELKNGPNVIQILKAIYFTEQNLIQHGVITNEDVRRFRWVSHKSSSKAFTELSDQSLGANADPTATIDDFLMAMVDGSSWRVWPYPEPPSLTFWGGLEVFTLRNQNVGLILKSIGPYDFIDAFEPVDITPHEYQDNFNIGSYGIAWYVNLRNTQGNYSTNLGFEIWWDRTFPIPNELLTTRSFLCRTDASPPNTAVNAIPASSCPGSINLSWGGVDVGSAGIWRFDVQYRIDNGPWTNLVTNTSSTSTSFGLSAGHTYYFQCRAKDRCADISIFQYQSVVDQHTEAYPGGNGDTYTIVGSCGTPDLYISSGMPTLTPITVAPGGTITVSAWTVRNLGTVSTGVGFQNGFYLSTNSTITTGDTYLDGNSNGPLVAGGSYPWGGQTLTIPTATAPGGYYIGILVDRANAVSESDESNNYESAPITVLSPPVDDNYEPNNTLATAFDLSDHVGQWLTEISGFGIQIDVDWYKIWIPLAASRVRVECQFVHSQGDIDISLFNSAEEEIAHSSGISDNELLDIAIQPNGDRYYVKVFYGNAGNSYDLLYGYSFGTGIEEFETTELPADYSLSQNYPNPFNPKTEIEFALPKASDITIEIFNLLGQKVRTLADEHVSAGYKTVSWDGADDFGVDVASGVYFYRVIAGEFFETKKMLLIK